MPQPNMISMSFFIMLCSILFVMLAWLSCYYFFPRAPQWKRHLNRRGREKKKNANRVTDRRFTSGKNIDA